VMPEAGRKGLIVQWIDQRLPISTFIRASLEKDSPL